MALRNKHASALAGLVGDNEVVKMIRPLADVNKIHYIRFPVRVTGGKRDTLLSSLLEKGIEASPMYVEHGMSIDSAIFPGAAKVADELLTLPCHPFMNQGDINLIGDVLAEYRR